MSDELFSVIVFFFRQWMNIINSIDNTSGNFPFLFSWFYAMSFTGTVYHFPCTICIHIVYILSVREHCPSNISCYMSHCVFSLKNIVKDICSIQRSILRRRIQNLIYILIKILCCFLFQRYIFIPWYILRRVYSNDLYLIVMIFPMTSTSHFLIWHSVTCNLI